MKNALNYVTYSICSTAVLGASFIGYIVLSGTPVQELKGVGKLFAEDVKAEVVVEAPVESYSEDEARAADTRAAQQVFDDAGLALGAFSFPAPFSVKELNALEARLTTKIAELAEREQALEQREREADRTREHLTDLESALEQQRSALLRQSDNNEARGAELSNMSGAVAAQRSALNAENELHQEKLAQLYADNKAEDAARMLMSAAGPSEAALILVRLEPERQAELLEEIESQRPEEFKAYYDAFNRSLASTPAPAQR